MVRTLGIDEGWDMDVRRARAEKEVGGWLVG
jgi:hypothetical protein